MEGNLILDHHIKLTKQSLQNIDIDEFTEEQIIVGSIANDLCEFTNEGNIFFHGKDIIDNSFKSRKSIFYLTAIWPSHFGNLSSLHSMAKVIDEQAETTKNEIISWFEFLNGLSVGQILIKPNAEIGKDDVPISYLFKNQAIEYDQIFDTEDVIKIRSRAIGMMCHLIQDLFTRSHCERNKYNEISRFYCYHAQDKNKHRDSDYVNQEFEKKLISQCSNCISCAVNKKYYDYNEILLLNNNVQPSGGGPFA